MHFGVNTYLMHKGMPQYKQWAPLINGFNSYHSHDDVG